jgi:hypothetical protein
MVLGIFSREPRGWCGRLTVLFEVNLKLIPEHKLFDL